MTSTVIPESTAVACISCDGRNLISWGRLPVYTADFLGRTLDANINAGTLYECQDCQLQFRAPQPSTEELLAYYQGLDAHTCWQNGPKREVWRYIKDELEDIPGRSILDIGCFRGDMLEYLGDRWERFGVEPSPEAGREAQNRGIRIIGETIESLRDEAHRFGAITMIDVAEHLPRPLDSLRLLTKLLLPGGKLLIFTGSTDALSWRLSGVDYYYSAMPEHVAFMRPSWFAWAAAKMNLEVQSIRRLRYESSSWRTRIDETFKNLLYIGYRRLKRLRFVPPVLFKIPLVRRIGHWQGCWWTSARDHTLVVLAKPAKP